MPSNFTKEEIALFDSGLEGFNDALVMSGLVERFNMDNVTAERSNDTIWRPAPYVGLTFDGLDQTGNFQEATQMSVPTSLGFKKSAPFQLSATELRDGTQAERLSRAAREKLASDINVAVMNTATTYGSVVVTRSGASSGYDDVAAADTAFNQIGVPTDSRCLALSSSDYNGMASNLAARQTMNEMPTAAYRRSLVGEVAGFETHKLDYGNRLTAATADAVLINGVNQRHTPKATSTAVTGETSNVDNRFQNIVIDGAGAASVKVGDAFTIAGVNSVHHITKEDTGVLKTFRVVEVVSATEVKIAPAIVCDDGGSPTEADKRYKNVTATPADNAVITFLNTAAASVNPFWHKSAIELLPASYAIGDTQFDTMMATTDQGIPVRMSRQGEINDLSTKYRLDVFFGTVALNPEMMGVMLFGQS